MNQILRRSVECGLAFDSRGNYLSPSDIRKHTVDAAYRKNAGTGIYVWVPVV